MAASSLAAPPLDRHGRPPGVLRLSLTARCNLACPYCLPDDRDPPGLLSTAERVALVTAAVGLGVHSLRLTGGEPLLHPRPFRPWIATAAPRGCCASRSRRAATWPAPTAFLMIGIPPGCSAPPSGWRW